MHGGFQRKVLTAQPDLLRNYPLSGKDHNIAGVGKGMIYLASTRNSRQLFRIDERLDSMQSVPINSYSLGIARAGIRTIVDSQFVYQMEAITPSFIFANTRDFIFSSIELPLQQFTDIVPLSPTSFIIRKYDTTHRQDILQKFSFTTHATLTHSGKYLLQKQQEGRFSLDGMLICSNDKKKIFYIYYYQNKFDCLDNDLQPLFLGRTIDTNVIAKLRIDEVQRDNSLTLSVPPPFVNKKAAVSDKYLLIQSGISSDQESVYNRDHASIDVYFTSSGAYKGSFYLPDSFSLGLKDLAIDGDRVIALYKHFIAVYRIKELV